MNETPRRVIAKALDGDAFAKKDAAERRATAIAKADQIIESLNRGGYGIERIWHDMNSLPPAASRPHELSGLYDSKDGMLYAFRAKRWREIEDD